MNITEIHIYRHELEVKDGFNLTAPFLTIRAALTHLRESRGAIIKTAASIRPAAPARPTK